MSKKGNCPICGKEVIIVEARKGAPFCSPKCASQARYMNRYRNLDSETKQRILEKLVKGEK